jgi:hypothetical protein
MATEELSRAIQSDDADSIPPGLLNVLVQHKDFERSDVSWLVMMLNDAKTDDDRRRVMASFRKQVWHVAAQEAWEAAMEDR